MKSTVVEDHKMSLYIYFNLINIRSYEQLFALVLLGGSGSVGYGSTWKFNKI